MSTTENARLGIPVLTTKDRCDCCQAAQAAVYVEMANGELLFCQHCFSQHEDALVAKALAVLTQ